MKNSRSGPFLFSSGRFAALLTAIVFTVSTSTMAAGGGGSGEDGDDGDTMTWVSLGLVVVVGGLLFLDVLAGPDGTSLEPDSTYIRSLQGLDTGIDWDSVFAPDTAAVLIGVSVCRTGDGRDISRDLIDQLTMLAPGGLRIYPDVVDLGSGTATEMAGMAWNYLGVDMLVIGTPEGDEGFLLLQAVTPDSIVVSASFPPGATAQDLLETVWGAAGSLSVEPELP